MSKSRHYELTDVDEVERMRQVRRDLEAQFESPQEFFDWMEELQRRHDERAEAKRKRRTVSKGA